MPEGFGLEPTGKECFRIECAETAECCEGFVPDANCATYEAACSTDPGQCLSYFSLCQCNQRCEDSLCVDRGPRCTSDDHCAFVTTPYCIDQACVACREHADCPAAGARCLDGACVEPCTSDAECPLLYACEGGTCVEHGCDTDRECAFLLGDGRSVCREHECQVPCSVDLECDQASFEVCGDGACVFAGCSTSAECRIVLGVEGEDEPVTAECR